MAKLTLITITPTKTYASHQNVIKAVEKHIGEDVPVRYFIHTHTDGRFFPVFIGEVAMQYGIHFRFNVIG